MRRNTADVCLDMQTFTLTRGKEGTQGTLDCLPDTAADVPADTSGCPEHFEPG